MILTNLHTHTLYCDGKSKVEEMINAAIKYNFQSIGLSSHGPVPFESEWNIKLNNIDQYINEILFFKDKYKNEIDVLLGMEIDYIPGIGFNQTTISIIKRLDYFIGSIHYLGKLSNDKLWTVDSNYEDVIKGIDESYKGNIRYAVETYYNLISEMVNKYEPPVIGHFDLIKKNNKENILFNENEDWYLLVVEKCLDSIRKTKSIVEINTGGIARGFLKEQYPSTTILKMIKEKSIPITINSDAHTPDLIDYKLIEMIYLIKTLGFRSIKYLTNKGWNTLEI